MVEQYDLEMVGQHNLDADRRTILMEQNHTERQTWLAENPLRKYMTAKGAGFMELSKAMDKKIAPLRLQRLSLGFEYPTNLEMIRLAFAMDTNSTKLGETWLAWAESYRTEGVTL